ncbi:MAG: helix-turn-helix transcriptional regulator [Cyanobacteriota bacterium]
MGNEENKTKEEVHSSNNFEVPDFIGHISDKTLDTNTLKTMEDIVKQDDEEVVENEIKYPYPTTAKWIQEARISKKLTQRAFSKISGISHGTISNIEISTHKVSVDIAITLCEALDIDIYAFCSKLENEYIQQSIVTIKESFKNKLLQYELKKNEKKN